ncbi:PREDICTED: probable RNA polymerase II nuclear localization protein SLC7A6OS [Dinoponera quadriceps]|uniref:Probable RNA polymerase II nuclear localization protein SLC7A6OS n=1 Tax=Dinoponera quadriceps TaxID=609295 RepID=A0A6P3WNR5_DINQU|nr:PREDICTED: probable RNA polymerase II nuclear localization protein SLC7A6OS [Dinoponera quadriceps]
MATILRVKRRDSVLPEDALILCKRQKLSNDDDDDEAAYSDVVPAIAKFAGTLKNPEESILKHLVKTLNKEELKATFKQHPSMNVLVQMREQAKENSAKNRYKVVNRHRSLNTSDIEEFEDKVMRFIDVEDSASLIANQNTAAAVIEEDEDKHSNYVYDVYYADNCDSSNDYVSIHPLNSQELVYETPAEEGYASDHDSNDSNAESYYQNSYPNTEASDEDSVDEDDMRAAIDGLRVYDFSSDEDYLDNTEDYGDEGEVHGCAYTRYKQRMKPLFDESEDTETSSENNSDNDDEAFLDQGTDVSC